MYKILVLNPGSTSTKVAYYEDSVNVCEQNLAVDRKVISGMKNIFDQMDLRKETIQKFLDEEHIDPKELSFIVSRGGGGGNLRAGGYIIDEALVQHCYDYDTPHASSLGPVIAYEMARQLGIPAFIYDGEGVNEFIDVALLSGFKEFPLPLAPIPSTPRRPPGSVLRSWEGRWRITTLSFAIWAAAPLPPPTARAG